MKKIIFILFCSIMLININSGAQAAEKSAKDPINWEISMMPEADAEEIENSRWSVIVENDLGVYAYDMASLQFLIDENKKFDKHIVTAKVKTLFTDKDILKKLKSDYKDKLARKEKVSYCEMDMQFNIQDKTYVVKKMDVYTDKNKLIETKINNTAFVPVPEKSFAEAMYEVCSKFVLETESANK